MEKIATILMLNFWVSLLGWMIVLYHNIQFRKSNDAFHLLRKEEVEQKRTERLKILTATEAYQKGFEAGKNERT